MKAFHSDRFTLALPAGHTFPRTKYRLLRERVEGWPDLDAREADPAPVDVLELADEHAPYGLRGIGEAPTLSATPAVLAAIRAATGLPLNRTPVRPEHLTGAR